MAKPMKTLELHYPRIQFLTMLNITEMWRSAKPMPVKSEKPTTIEATDSLNMRENKCEKLPVVMRRRRKRGEKKKMAADDVYIFLCHFITLRALSHL